MELRVNDYVRTKDGLVRKIVEIDKLIYIDKDYISDEPEYHNSLIEEDVIKSSPNIIELFEEHDLVVIEYYSLRYKEKVTRLFEVDYKDKEFMTLKNAHCDFMLRNNEFNDEDKKLKPIIKSIVTCEQFSQMEYKVGD